MNNPPVTESVADIIATGHRRLRGALVRRAKKLRAEPFANAGERQIAETGATFYELIADMLKNGTL